MANLPNKRDKLLDFYKGMAIILVVVGHTFQQYNLPNFDESLGFRIIYSFHMPLFIFLSGAATATWLENINLDANLYNSIKGILSRVYKSAIRLLLPFAAWGMIRFYMRDISGDVYTYIISTFLNPDISLWFLICIFYCIFLCCLLQILFISIVSWSPIRTIIEHHHFKKIGIGNTFYIFAFLSWIFIRKILPSDIGLYLLSSNFKYFLLGALLFKLLPTFHRKRSFYFSFLIFFGLVWFWHRDSQNNIISSAPYFLGRELFERFYAFIIAFSGTLVMLRIQCSLYHLKYLYINKIIVYLGKISLGIYALQEYFLQTQPAVIAPIVICTIISSILLQIPIIKTVFLGESNRPHP